MQGKRMNLDKTVNYAEVYSVCQSVVEGKPVKLIETVAEKIARMKLQRILLIK